jgi:hypothetical protein
MNNSRILYSNSINFHNKTIIDSLLLPIGTSNFVNTETQVCLRINSAGFLTSTALLTRPSKRRCQRPLSPHCAIDTTTMATIVRASSVAHPPPHAARARQTTTSSREDTVEDMLLSSFSCSIPRVTRTMEERDNQHQHQVVATSQGSGGRFVHSSRLLVLPPLLSSSLSQPLSCTGSAVGI